MPDTTTIQSLPLIQPSQAQKHITHNEALKIIDVLIQLSVVSRGLSAPPTTPTTGDCYIVGPSATGSWLGQEKSVAVFGGIAWEFYPPRWGWSAYIADEGEEAVYNGTIWAAPSEAPAVFSELGVSATPDSTNRLTVSSPASLFDNAGAGHQLKINKASSADTASVLFQTGHSGRVEMGTTGSDDFSLKVSPDGTTFTEGLRVTGATGRVTALNGVVLNPAAGDIASPGDGSLWYNSTSGTFRARAGGVSADVLTGSNVVVQDSGFAIQDNLDPTKQAQFQVAGLTTGTTRTLTVPNLSGTIALLDGAGQSFTATVDFAAMGSTFGSGTGAGSISLGGGATLSGSTKTVNVGTAGVAGSTTNVAIGSAVSGALGTTTINTPTVTFASSVTAVAMGSASLTALYAGLGGATGDATNRLAINAPATLLNNAGAGHQLKVNKNAATDTASLMFQTGFSGRAEMGTTGSDDFTIKVSPDGSTFTDALTFDRTTGRTKVQKGLRLTPAAGDLSGPVDGEMWYDSTAAKFRARQNGASVDVIGGGGGGGTVFSDSAFTIQDNGDATKQLRFEVSGITTGTTRTLTVPDVSSTLATLGGTQTFSGAVTFSGPVVMSGTDTIVDSNFTLQDDVDNTKKAQFQLSGITTGNTRVFTLPDAATSLAGLSVTQTWASGQTFAGGTNTLGNSTAASTTGIATGATTSGNTKAVNIGTAGLSGSTTTIAVGSAVSGAAGSLTVNSPTVAFGATVTAINLPDAATFLIDNADATKKLQFEVSGVTTGTTRTVTAANASGTMVLDTAAQTLTNKTIDLGLNTITGTMASTNVGMTGGGTAQDYAGFATRAAFVTWTSGKTPATGTVIDAAGFSYRYIGSGTAISDLAGWVPLGFAFPDHWAQNVTPGTTNMAAAITSALAYSSTVYLSGSTYAVASTLSWDNGSLIGSNDQGTAPTKILGLSASIPVGQAIVAPGRSSTLRCMQIGYDTLTGSETQDQRVGLDTRGLTLNLQRGSEIDEVTFDNVGTAISDFGVGEFSVTFGTIEIVKHSYRAVDIRGTSRTGSVWLDVYINGGSTYTPEGGFCHTGQGTGGFVGQLNVEQGAYSGFPVRIEGEQGLVINSLHIEGVDCTTTNFGYVGLDSASITIHSLNVLNTRMSTDNTAVVRLARAGYQSTVVSPLLTTVSAASNLKIGKLHVKGLASPSTTLYPTYPTGRTGVRNCPGFNVFKRATSFTDNNWQVEVLDYLWAAYTSQAADQPYLEFPDVSFTGQIQIKRVGERGRDVVPFENYVLNGAYDKWLATTATVTSGAQEVANKWTLRGATGSLTVDRVQDGYGAVGQWDARITVGTAGTAQSWDQDVAFPVEWLGQNLRLTFDMKAAAAGRVLEQITATLVNNGGGAPSSVFKQVISGTNTKIDAATAFQSYIVDFTAVDPATITTLGTAAVMRLSFQFNDVTASRAPTVTFRNVGLAKVAGTKFARAPFDRLALAAADVSGLGALASASTVNLSTQATGTLQAAQEPAHTGDVTNSAGSLALTLATVNSNVGAFGSASQVPVITVNGKGLITAVSTASVAAAPAGSTTQVQYNNAGSAAGATDILVENNQLRLPTASSFTAPAAGGTRFLGRADAGRTVPAFLSQDGVIRDVQTAFTRSSPLIWKAQAGVASLTVLGGGAPTAVGTATLAAIATTSLVTYTPRLEYLVTTAATTAIAGFRGTNISVTVGGPSAALGGFHFVGRWGPATGVATTTNRAFFGMANIISAPSDVEPSTTVNCVAMGWDAADTNIQMMTNDASGTCTKTDLGASFPVPTTDRTALYELAMYSPKGTTQSVAWLVTDLVSGATASGTITTDMPAATSLLAPRGWMSVGGTSSVIGLGLNSLILDPLL